MAEKSEEDAETKAGGEGEREWQPRPLGIQADVAYLSGWDAVAAASRGHGPYLGSSCSPLQWSLASSSHPSW